MSEEVVCCGNLNPSGDCCGNPILETLSDTENPCETHLDVQASGYCPVCLYERMEEAEARSQALHDLITEAAEWCEQRVQQASQEATKATNTLIEANLMDVGNAYRACADHLRSQLSGDKA